MGEAASPQSAWRTEGAILVLRVDGPRAIEVQHRAEQILERVNIYFGYRAVAQMRIFQAPVPKAKSQQGPIPAPGSVEEPSFAAGVADTGLAKALGRLAAGIRGKTRDLETRFRFSRFCHKEMARERETTGRQASGVNQ